VPGLGQPGDVKEVANGYARNYLLPRQLVSPATASELANLRTRVAAAQARAAKLRSASETLAQRIGGVELTFAVRTGRDNRLYGSVTTQNIAEALRDQEELSIDRRMIQLKEPLRQLGEFEVPVRVAPGLEPKLKVRIVSNAAVATPAGEAAAEASDDTDDEPQGEAGE
jgi:large subunit ribosomal protein L9